MAERDALSLLQAGGFTASVDALAWEPDPDPATRRMWLWFLWLLGPQQSLRALWARLLKGEPATLSRETLGQTRFCVLAPEGPRTWRTYTAGLPAAGRQLVLLPEAARYAAAREDFLLLPLTPEEAPLLHFRFLDRRVDLPLHVCWHGWLWERALRTGESVALETEGIVAFRCTPNPDALAADLSAAVRSGLLRVPGEAAGGCGGASRLPSHRRLFPDPTPRGRGALPPVGRRCRQPQAGRPCARPVCRDRRTGGDARADAGWRELRDRAQRRAG